MRGLLAVEAWRFRLAIAVLAVGAGALTMLFFFDPATCGYYPVCWLHQTTGLLCPGCGTLRALHQLTHGHFAEAWRLNFLVVALVPIGLWLVVRELIRLATGWELPGIVTRPIFGWVLVAALILFGILRNVPLARLIAMVH